LFGWIPLILVLFAVLPARRAVFAAYLIGWMFLPMATFKLTGIPEYSKISATNLGVMLGILLFDTGRIGKFRPRLVDLPMAVWCACSFVSSVQNGLGAYDGMSAMTSKVLTWGLPYFIGRIYLTDLAAVREMAVALFVGGVVYMPFCLLEMKISPQLHRLVYGYHQHDFGMTVRFGGYRPMVFMQHGLMVSMWMATAALSGLWLWQTNSLKRLWGLPAGLLVAAVMVTAVLCKSVNSLGLLALGIGVLYASRMFKTKVFLVLLVAIAPAYLVLRISGTLRSEDLVAVSKEFLAADRVQSFEFRLDNEDLLVAKAMRQPITGWAGWNRSRVVDEDGIVQGITDGLWVIAIGENGLLGLSAVTAALLVPSLLLVRRMRVRDWGHPLGSAAAVLAVVGALHMIDNLPNGMFNPVYVLGVGGLAGLRRRTVEEDLEEWDWRDVTPGVMATGAAYEEMMLPGYGAGSAVEYR
jgi:hypothetical protein